MESVVLQYPSWLIFLCLLLGAGYATFHYYRSKDFGNKPWLNALLAILRGTVVSIIALLLLNPVVRTIFEELKTPIVVFGIDQSLSIAEATNEDERQEIIDRLSEMAEDLSADYQVEMLSIGSEVTTELDTGFTESQTNLSDFLEYVRDNYAHLNVGGIVLASDGIYNVGKNPLYTDVDIQAPIHTLRLGDTTTPRDINIRNIFHNEIAFLNDDFEVEVDIDADNCQGKSTRVTLLRFDGQNFNQLGSKTLTISKGDEFFTVPFQVNAGVAGVQRYRVVAEPLDQEVNERNNVRDFFIEVLDSRIEILLVRQAPHPDVAAFKAIVSASENYEMNVAGIEDAASLLSEADLVIFHDLPGPGKDIHPILKQMNDRGIPRLFIFGSQTSPSGLNRVQNSIALSGSNGSTNEAQPLFTPTFNLFESNENLPQYLSDFPPLISLFGEYQSVDGAEILANQRIGTVNTEYPLMAFNQVRGIKEGIIVGEGIWRWRLVDFLRTGDHENIDALVRKIVQYLSVKENKEKFRVRSIKNLYDDSEDVVFTAEVYNDAYEAVTDPEVYLTVTSANGEEYRYTFSRSENSYVLEAGRLKPGNYSYRARTTFNGQEMTKSGAFAIKAIELEYYNTVADHGLLKTLSERQGGRSFALNELSELRKTLVNSEMKPTIAYASRTRSAMHFKWIFVLLALLLSGEWFLRRYYGRY